jgi:hypothetical protein
MRKKKATKYVGKNWDLVDFTEHHIQDIQGICPHVS